MIIDFSFFFFIIQKPLREDWNTGVEALSDALNLEAQVTRSIRDIIITCENPKTSSFNDYHVSIFQRIKVNITVEKNDVNTSQFSSQLVDYLTSDFLDEQYKGQRDLAGKISTLGKMMQTHGQLGEFLFDKKLLNGEV